MKEKHLAGNRNCDYHTVIRNNPEFRNNMIKKIFTFIVLTTTLISCSGNQKDAQERKYIPMNEVKDVMTNLKPLKATFEISANDESVIQGEEGTVIYIPANSFEFADGTKPKGKIKIEFRECYNNASIIGQGLHTNSRGNILASGGMVYIAAKADGKDLEIKEGNALQIGFPKPNSTSDMDLFYSVKAPSGSTTWIPDYKMFELDQVEQSEESNTDSAPAPKYPIDLSDNEYRYDLSFALGSGDIMDARIVGYNGNVYDYLNDQSTVSDSFAKPFYLNEWRVHLEFKLNEQGKMYGYRPDKLNPHLDDDVTNDIPEAVQQTQKYFNSIPPIDFTTLDDGYKKNRYYALGIMGSRSIDWQKFKEKFRSKFQKSLNDASVKISGFELDNYVFAVTKLGWINCDRFLDIPEDQKIDFIVTSTESSEQKIRLIFENNGSERTIMNGETKDGETIFKNVPIGQQITVLGIGLKNGSPKLAKSKTKITKSPFTLSNYKEVDIVELESELNRIN